MLPPHSVSCSFPSTASLMPVGDVYLPFGLDARLSSGWGWGWPRQGGGNELGRWTMEGKGGLRESSKLGCPGEMWKRRMQKAHSCSSGGCPCICLSCQGSKWSSDRAETSPPGPLIHMHFSVLVCTQSLHLPIPSPFPSIHPRTSVPSPRRLSPSPCMHPASPPSPWPHGVREL